KAPPLLAFYEIDPARRRDVMVYRVDESVMPVAATAANERSPTLSSDGRWIAFVSDASGRDEIYVKEINATAPPVQLTTTGASEPVAARDGLFYRHGDRLLFARWTQLSSGGAEEIFEGVFERDPGANLAAYDVERNGERFLMLKSAVSTRQMRVVVN